MAYTVSLASLTRGALQRANLEGVRASQSIKEPELTGYVNGSIAEWVDEVRATTWNGNYSRSAWPITTVANMSSYALAPDFLSLISVDVTITSGGPVIAARAYQEEQRNAFRSGGWGWEYAAPIYYQMQGTNIAFIPVPQGPYAVQVNYVPTAPILVAQADTIDSINGWEEFIHLDVAIKCLAKLGGNDQIPILAQRLEHQRARIRSLAPRRDMQTAERVHVIENANFGDDWDW